MDEHQVEVKEIRDAKKASIEAEEGLQLARKAETVLAAKGKKIVEFSLSSGKLEGNATEEDLEKAIIGPSGKLRAPSLWIGDTLVVGYHPEMYASVLS